MTTATPLTLHVTPEQRQKIEHLAEVNGYETPDDYLLSVIESLIEDPTKEEVLEDLRVSFREAFSGQTIPVAEMLADLEADDDE
jgi:hypothetical protein